MAGLALATGNATLSDRLALFIASTRPRLSELSGRRLRKIINTQVVSRIVDGDLDTDARRLMVANVAGIIRGIRDNDKGDQALAECLGELLDVLARRPIAPVRRTLDAAMLNEVANNPDVRPWLRGEGDFDLTDLIANPANFALVTDGGGFVLHNLSPGEYEVHSLFLPDARQRTVQTMRAAMDYMFTRTDCQRLVTKVPDDNQPAANLARVGGFREVFRREGCWNGVGAAHMALTLEDWALGCMALEADGEWFHARLEDAKRASGSDLPEHDHDPAHERAVGAAVRMMRAGNVAKALGFYNRWAVFAGYAPIAVIRDNPVMLDVEDAVIELRGDDMEVLTCR